MVNISSSLIKKPEPKPFSVFTITTLSNLLSWISYLDEPVLESAAVFFDFFSGLPKSCLLNIVYDAGKNAHLQIDSLHDSIDPANWIADGIQSGINEVNGYLQNGLTFLATVGSTAPFVGLFGTVWAIYHALIKIGDSGQASLDKVAGPVGEALIMTAIGLAVAVPAVLGYNWLVRRNKTLMESVTNFGNTLYVSFFTKQ